MKEFYLQILFPIGNARSCGT